jgi:hypothetical protein
VLLRKLRSTRGGGSARSPLPDALKSLGLFHAGRISENLSP